MIFRTLGLSLVLISSLAYAQGRKPAVEDFVGIEIEQDQVAPHGTESLFNLEQDINKIEAKKSAPVVTNMSSSHTQTVWGPQAFIGIIFALGLPLFIWFMAMNHLKRKASVESASNIEVLEKYRKEREKKSTENIRKAS